MSKPSAIRPAGQNPLAFGINMMLYAHPGAGKSPFIANRPKTLILDLDKGTASTAGSPAEVWPVNSWTDMDEVYEFCRHELRDEYEWVWMDGISIGQDVLLEDVMIDLIKPTSQGGRGKTHRKTYLIDQGEYGENFNRLKQWVRHMQALPFNFGITAHVAPSTDEATGDTKLWPWIQGRQMPQTISGSFDIIAYAERKEDKFLVHVKETDDYYARDRFSALGAGLEDPSIASIEKRIHAKLGVSVQSRRPAPATVAAKPVSTKPGPRPVARKRV